MFKQRTKYAIPLILIVLITTLVIPVGPVGDTDVAQAATDPDLLIIAPMEFSAALQLLVDHKNSTGMPAELLTLESIYGYFPIGDEPEKVKKAIKLYYDDYDIKYVMLVGDCNKFPVRWQYGHLVDGLIGDNITGNEDQVYDASDFYYADLYDQFDAYNDWDADGDGYYGELYSDNISSDGIDPIPEVAVARVPAQNVAEVVTYVNKVIYYELNTHNAAWFKNLLLIQDGWSEDLYAKENIATHLGPLGFDTTRLYTSINASIYSGPDDGDPEPVRVSEEFNSGYGFVSELFHGHTTDWDYIFSVDNVTTLENNPMLPVIFSDACDTAKFYDKTIPYRIYTGIDGLQHGGVAVGSVNNMVYAIPDPIQPFNNVMGIGEAFLVASENGAIAYYGSLETGEPQFHKVLDEAFFEAYSLGHNILGDMWEYAIVEFATVYDLRNLTANNGWKPVCKAHTPSRFLLLGDPSLRVGGIDREQMPPGTYWARMFSEDTAARDIVDTGDGYAVAGYWWDSEEYAFNYQTVLVKYDYDGNLIDSMTLADPQYNGAYAIIHDGITGDLMVTGFKQFTDGAYTDPWVWMMSVNSTLDKKWEAVHGSPFDDRGNGIIPDGDGYIIAGWEGIGNSPIVGSGYMVRTHSNGTLDWEVRGLVADPTTHWLSPEIHSVERTADGGAILGTESGMRKVSFASPPAHQWTGGEGEYFSARQTSDGGYIGVGRKVVPSMWKTDPYGLVLTKLDATGAVTWSHANYGNSKPIVGSDDIDDVGYDVIEVDDGYVITGSTESWAYHGNGDLWVIKTDLSGNMEWDLVLGSDGYDNGRAVLEAPDGSYIIAGRTSHDGVSRIWTVKVTGGFTKPVASFTYNPPSPVFVEQQVNFDAAASYDSDGNIVTYKWDFGDDTTGGGVSPSHTYHAPGLYNVTLYVLDNDGLVGDYTLSISTAEMEMQWEQLYGDGRDYGHDITFAIDGGFVVAGSHVTGSSTYNDIWAFKTDSRGNEAWNKVYPGAYGRSDAARCVTIAQDGGYIVAGYQEKSSTDREIWIIKVAEDTGDIVWQKFHDYGSGQDEAYDIKWDGTGYIITGLATADDPARFYDMMLLKIDLNGDEVWQETYPDPDGKHTCGNSVTPTTDGGYIITGGYRDNNQFDGPLLTVKVKSDRDEDWRTDTGTDGSKSSGMWIDQTADTGYIVAGSLEGDFALLKYTPGGVVDWSENWGWASQYDFAHAAATTVDGGYIITGGVLDDLGNDDLYIVRTDDSGNLQWDWQLSTEETTEAGHGVLTYSDGSCVVLGTRYPGNDGSTWLFKLGPNTPPNANFTYDPASPESGVPVNFDASSSFDEDGTIDQYLWEFDDGDDDTDGTGETPFYTFPATGNYDVTLTVVDEDGGVDTETQTISVAQGFEVDFHASPTSGEAPLTVNFYNDVIGGTPPYVYAWDVGDDGFSDNTSATPSWVYTEPGVYTVSLEATDATPQTRTETKTNYITVSGITTSEPTVTITTTDVTDNPSSEPLYTTGAPEDVDWATARGFNIEAMGTVDGTYAFQIVFETPVTPGLVLYKLPDWTEITYVITGTYTIEVELDIVSGILDPPFVLTGDDTPPTMRPIAEAQGQYFTIAPAFSNFGFDDGLALDDGWYQIDSFTGAWTSLFADEPDKSWDNDGWPIPGFAGLPDGSHTVYFMASDDAGNVEGESGEWSWQFNKDITQPTMESINEAEGHYFNSAPVFSNFGFDDGLSLNDGWYQIDSFTGTWTSLFTDDSGTSWDNDGWSIPGFASLADGSHTIYFRATDDAGNEEGENGEWSWQFIKDITPPTMRPIAEAQGQYFTIAPAFSNFGFDDGLALNDGWYQIDSFTGAWTSLFADEPDKSWDSDGWAIPGFAALADGSHTIYFRAIDDAGNEEGENGEWSWQFNKGAAPSGGGGGGGGGALGLTAFQSSVDPEGRLINDVTALSSDVQHYIVLKKGTYCLDATGSPVYWIYFRIAEDEENLPSPPEGSIVITPYYEIDPAEATFNPPVPCTFRYKLWGLPEGADPSKLTVMLWDPVNEQWLPMETQVDAEKKELVVMLEHLSLYTVMLVPQPATFEVSNLSITPSETDIDGEVTVSVLVTNNGDLSGDCTVACKVNGTIVDEQAVTVEAGDRQDVVFTISRAAAGTYTIDVNGLSGQFTVSAPPEPEPTQEPEPEGTPQPEATPKPEKTPEQEVTQEPAIPTTPVDEVVEEPGVSMPWWTYVLIITAVIVLGLGAWLFYKRRTSTPVKPQ